MNKRTNLWAVLLLAAVALCLTMPLFAQETNSPPATVGDDFDINIVTAMVKQVLNSPASLLVIVGLSILAWVIEGFGPHPRVIPTFCVLGGAASYWLFSAKSSVPAEFPNPSAVLVVNGLICGFVSYIAHGKLVMKFFPKKNGTNGTNGVLLLLAGGLALGSTACATRLAQGGVYQSDTVLYNAELAITTAYDVIHTYVAWEKENRQALARWPEIKQSADTMRENAKDWFNSAHALRDAYAADPTPGRAEELKKALDVLRAALKEAAKYMAQASE